MFNETSYNDDGFGGADKAAKQAACAQGEAACQAWKQQQRQLESLPVQTGGIAPVSLPPMTMPAPAGSASSTPLQAPTGDAGSTDILGGIGNFFSNVPPTLLYGGLAVVAFMLLKKR